ncbi:MAG: hypothetical protein OEO77_05180 [Acidimicrobiia bacterium]|nr:hypothetical protein [Acidimicrobiia bacterium]
MTTTTEKQRRTLSTCEQSILAVHGLVAGIVGTVGFLGANDPGWGDLQRLVILMLIGLWMAGIVAMGLIARLFANKWARAMILLGGPVIGIAIVFGRSILGWG